MEGWFKRKTHTHTQQEGGFHPDTQKGGILPGSRSDVRKPGHMNCGSDAEQRPVEALASVQHVLLFLTHRRTADAAPLCVGRAVWDVQLLLMRSALPIQ